MTDLSMLFAKWLCHDLATPAATVLTASELLGPVGDAEVNHLVHDGAQRLVARLKLIRTAFAPGGPPLAAPVLERLIREGIAGTPLTWTLTDEVSGGEAAMIAGAALLLADLARGAALTVGANGAHWDVSRPLPEPAARALAGGGADEPRAALAALAAAAAARAGRTLAATADGVAWH